jgi:hypothetical protein
MCLAVNIHDGKCACQHRHERRNIRIVLKNKKDSESIVTSTLLFSKHLVWSSCIPTLGATPISYKSLKLQKFGERTPELLECTNLWGAHTRTICMNSIDIHALAGCYTTLSSSLRSPTLGHTSRETEAGTITAASLTTPHANILPAWPSGTPIMHLAAVSARILLLQASAQLLAQSCKVRFGTSQTLFDSR